MVDLNKVILQGHLGQDPEVRNTNSGQKVVFLSLATNYSYKDKAGDWKTETEWHKISVFKQDLVLEAKMFAKRDNIKVEGYIKTNKWEDKSGAIKYSTAIIATSLEKVYETSDEQGQRDLRGERPLRGQHDPQSTLDLRSPRSDLQPEDLDDDIPF